MGGRLKLGQILISKNLIGPEQLASALGEQERWGSRLGMTLVRMGFLDEETLVRVLASQLRLPVARIRGKTVNPEVLSLVPMEIAEKYRCLPLFVREQGGAEELLLAMEDPSDLEGLGELSFQVGRRLRPVLVAPSELEDALQRHYHGAALTPAAHSPLPPLSASPPPTASSDSERETEPELPPMDPLLDPNLEGPAASAPDAAADLGPELESDPLEGSDLAGETGGQDDPLGLSREDAFDAFPAEPFGGFHEEPFSADREPEPDADTVFQARPDPQPAASRARDAMLEPRVILQALAQLLVERGVITREEFAERLRQLAARSEAGL